MNNVLLMVMVHQKYANASFSRCSRSLRSVAYNVQRVGKYIDRRFCLRGCHSECRVPSQVFD